MNETKPARKGNAAKRGGKIPAKQPVFFSGGLVDENGRTVVDNHVWAIPDHWDLKAPRWKGARARGALVVHRCEYARLLREMRSSKLEFPSKGSRHSRLCLYLVKSALRQMTRELLTNTKGGSQP